MKHHIEIGFPWDKHPKDRVISLGFLIGYRDGELMVCLGLGIVTIGVIWE